ncbi:MAG: SGNH/GDSL hydrolase family protein [Caulobacteraceae bacterium]|nr:MAG: SGNH/GDSL hydrolase family protein [Caulobacteraceae bacterium]
MIKLSSFDTQPAAKYARVQLLDGSGGAVQAKGQAYFMGRTFPRWEQGAGQLVEAVLRGGTRMRMRVTGTASLGMRYVGSPKTSALDVFVNGARKGSAVSLTAGSSTFSGASLLTDLDPALTYDVELRVRGVDQYQDRWMKGEGLHVHSFYGDGGKAGKIAPWIDRRAKMLFYGDSITDGVIARAATDLPLNAAGDVSWPTLSAEALDLQAIVNGFGGQGLTVASSTGIPKLSDAAFLYMNGRPIDTVEENARYVVVNIGTNDGLQSVGNSTFQTAYRAFLQSLLKAHPGAERFFCMRPFGGYYEAQISAAVAAMGDPRFVYINTSGWTGITFTDEVHLNIPGHASAATQFAAAALTSMSVPASMV